MRKIAIIGDVRKHAFFGQKSQTASSTASADQDSTEKEDAISNSNDGSWFLRRQKKTFQWGQLGGAVLMTRAIKEAILELIPNPELLCYEEDELTPVLTKPNVLQALWDIKPTTPEGEKAARLRLSDPSPISRGSITDEELPFPKAITNHIVDKRPSKVTIDLLAIDDLGHFVRRLKLPDAQILDLSEPLPRFSTGNYQEQLSALLDIFKARIRAGNTHGIDGLSPLIIASVGTMLPDLKDEGTLWHRLHFDDDLRSRTIVVLDVDELRAEGIKISTAVSWEKCAQDLLGELGRHDRLKYFRNFRHVIVRFGVTGAMHVYRDEAGGRYRLYFDPAHSDTHFSNLTTEGHVLGHSSLIVASLIQSIARACNRRSGGGYLPIDLVPAVGEGVKLGVSRCQLLYRHGYGIETVDWMQLAEQNGFLPPGLLTHYVKLVLDASLSGKFASFWPESQIGVCEVPTFQSEDWSILSQSSELQLQLLAKQVVERGIDKTLNRVEWTEPALRDGLTALLSQLGPTLNSKTLLTNSHPLTDSLDWPTIVRDSLPPLQTHSLKPDLPKSIEVTPRLDTPTPSSPNRILAILFAFRDVLINRDGISDGKATVIDNLLGLYGPEIERQLTTSDLTNKSENRGAFRLRSAITDWLSKVDLKKKNQASRDFAYELTQLFFDAYDLHEVFKADIALYPAPFAKFGEQLGKTDKADRRMAVVDRREIEGLRVIHNLISEHVRDVEDERAEKPLSIAVFGPPGSGKSFAVSQVLNSIVKGTEAIERIKVNLAQLTKPEDLDAAFKIITNAMANKKIPIAFFDEFDASFQGIELGWLKFFLAPMEDGEFKGDTVNKAIFVFAGATAETFREFSRQGREKADPQWSSFASAKGPDFVSRLRGHLNVIGVNRSNSRDDLYLVRRAIALRALLEKIQDLGPGETSRIDGDVLHALLLVPEYKHGTRSMRNVLDLFRDRRTKITHSALPPIAQLDMHISPNGKSFLDLAHEHHRSK